MEAALATLKTLVSAEGRGGGAKGRAVAVLGDMLELGAAEEEEHRMLGRKTAGAGVAVAAFYGPRSPLTFKEFSSSLSLSSSSSSSSSSTAHFTEIEPLVEWLLGRLAPGDVVLVKGSRGMKLERVVDALLVPPTA
jgi:UDP-N-acetylmuramoyl-tripeptide--D-alanyl-D-alanine ligase